MPTTVKDIIVACWSANAKARPTAAKVGWIGGAGLVHVNPCSHVNLVTAFAFYRT